MSPTPESPVPEIAVVVPSHERPLRLRWLLNALAEQTLAPGRFEVIVCDDSRTPEVPRLLAGHPLARACILRSARLTPGSGTPSRQRNTGWRLARAPLVAFTDDDCRPPPSWLEQLLAAARAHPGAVVQGATRPDPEEAALLHAAPRARSLAIEPPDLYAQTCNILYPRVLLERLGGFDEAIRRAGGEDTDLALRARALGAAQVGAPAALTHHAVEVLSLRQALRVAWRWQDLPAVLARHPQVRRELVAGVFWRRSHARLPLAVAGLALAPRHPALGALALPWTLALLPSRGGHLRGRLRAVSELPGRALIDVTEFAALARGSVRHRALML